MKNIETIDVTFGDKTKDYLIDIGKKITYRLTEFIDKHFACQRIMIITDKTVAGYYLDDLQSALSFLGVDVYSYVINPGEESKTLAVAHSIYSQLAKESFSRSDLIITFGGGVVGDLGGYVAATFKRGIPFIQIPTTLLSQVDSSVGGKVAVNIEEGKNLVGAFYQPKYVLIDTYYLNTLEESQWLDGLGEIIKYAFIGSESLFHYLKKHQLESLKNEISYVISTCCKIKRDFVVEDEFDTGVRMSLNFGHTLGHAIEKYYGFGVISHGQAVAMGMFLIMRQVEMNNNFTASVSHEIESLLLQYNLFRKDILENYSAYCNDILNDKKVLDGNLNIIIVDKIGESRIYPLKLSQARLLLNQKTN
jgi:3-dehydroquinate synthase